MTEALAVPHSLHAISYLYHRLREILFPYGVFVRAQPVMYYVIEVRND